MHSVSRHGSSTPAVPVGIQGVDRRLGEFDKRLDQIARSDRIARIAVLAVTLFAFGMMAWFASSLWRLAERRFTEETVQAAVMATVQDRWPSIQRKLIDEVSSAAPKLGTLAVERAGKVWPQLSDRLIASLRSLGEDLEGEVRDRSAAALQRVSAKLTADISRDFPAFTADRSAAFCERIRSELLADGSGFIDELEGVIRQEQEKVGSLLAKLPLAEVADRPEGELQKKFIHHVLMMIDAIVEQQPVSESSAAAPNAAPAVAARRSLR